MQQQLFVAQKYIGLDVLEERSAILCAELVFRVVVLRRQASRILSALLENRESYVVDQLDAAIYVGDGYEWAGQCSAIYS